MNTAYSAYILFRVILSYPIVEEDNAVILFVGNR